ncbi:hypothetical protein MMC16_005930 [Acarospora aff. strigata]|nr:hypothetical protein [Acarospora aff. strigata]
MPLYTPSSPLSPTPNSAAAPVSPHSTARSSRNINSLRLANLGRYSHAPHQSIVANPDDMSKPAQQKSTTRYQSHSRQYSDAQVALQNFQRELIANATRSSRSVATSITYKPLSPRLIPLGSPGPVTPLMLEEDDGYFLAGAVRSGMGLNEGEQRELVERLILEDDRRNNLQTGRVSTVSPAGGSD